MAGTLSQPVTYSCLPCVLRCDVVHLNAAQVGSPGSFEFARLSALFREAWPAAEVQCAPVGAG